MTRYRKDNTEYIIRTLPRHFRRVWLDLWRPAGCKKCCISIGLYFIAVYRGYAIDEPLETVDPTMVEINSVCPHCGGKHWSNVEVSKHGGGFHRLERRICKRCVKLAGRKSNQK